MGHQVGLGITTRMLESQAADKQAHGEADPAQRGNPDQMLLCGLGRQLCDPHFDRRE